MPNELSRAERLHDAITEADRAVKRLSAQFNKAQKALRVAQQGQADYTAELRKATAANTALRAAEARRRALLREQQGAAASLVQWLSSLRRGWFLLAFTAAAAARGLVGVTREIIRAADAVSLMRNQLGLVASDTIAAQQRVFALAQETRQALDTTTQLFVRTSQALRDLVPGATQENVLAFTRAVQQSFIISGSSAVEATNSTRQLTQALASGVLRGDEFRSIAENNLRLTRAIVREAGVANVGELRELAYSGGLSAQTVYRAILGQAGRLNAEFQGFERTAEQAHQQLGNSLTVLGGMVSETFGIREGWVDIIDSIREAADFFTGPDLSVAAQAQLDDVERRLAVERRRRLSEHASDRVRRIALEDIARLEARREKIIRDGAVSDERGLKAVRERISVVQAQIELQELLGDGSLRWLGFGNSLNDLTKERVRLYRQLYAIQDDIAEQDNPLNLRSPVGRPLQILQQVTDELNKAAGARADDEITERAINDLLEGRHELSRFLTDSLKDALRLARNQLAHVRAANIAREQEVRLLDLARRHTNDVLDAEQRRLDIARQLSDQAREHTNQVLGAEARELERIQRTRDEIARIQATPTADRATAEYFDQQAQAQALRFAQERRRIENNVKLSIQERAALLARVDAQEILAIQQLVQARQRNLDQLERAYGDAFRNIGRSIGQAFRQFEDNLQGWVSLVLEALPEIIQQFRELRDTANSVRLGGGDTGSGFLGNFFGSLFGGRFHNGGVIPGPLGADRLILAQAGETVVPIGGNTGSVTLNVQVVDRGGDVQTQIRNMIPQLAAAVGAVQYQQRAGA